MSNKIVATVDKYIRSHHLMDADQLYLVALSGGADSVSLLLILHTLGFHVEAVHCNFHLRGAESDRDEFFVKDLCQRLEIPLHISHFDTTSYAELHHVSIEMAARELRYRYFEQLRADLSAAGICVAHHRDDSVETLLMNLIRGTGIHGLSGIRPVNGYILRPMLCVSRLDIETYLSDVHQPYVTDSTNLVDDITRNKLRLNIIPMLREINPSVSENIQKTAERVSDILPLVDDSTTKEVGTVIVRRHPNLVLSLSMLRKSLSPENVLFSILSEFGFSPYQIEQIYGNLESPSGTIYRSLSHELAFDRDAIIVDTPALPVRPIRLPEEGIYVCQEHLKLHISVLNNTPDIRLAVDHLHAFFDADKVIFPLILRQNQSGDKFVPFGMKGQKLLSDYMTDCKKNYFEKQRQMVLTDANGDILWIVDERTDNRYRVTSSTTKILCIINKKA